MRDALFVVVFYATWLSGIVIASGIIQTMAAVFAPPYAWYLFVERLMQLAGIV